MKKKSSLPHCFSGLVIQVLDQLYTISLAFIKPEISLSVSIQPTKMDEISYFFHMHWKHRKDVSFCNFELRVPHDDERVFGRGS